MNDPVKVDKKEVEKVELEGGLTASIGERVKLSTQVKKRKRRFAENEQTFVKNSSQQSSFVM